MKDRLKCKHKKAYFFHENAPAYCTSWDSYVDGDKVIPNKKK